MKQETVKLNDPNRAKIIAEIQHKRPQRRSKPRQEREDKGSAGPWQFACLIEPVAQPRMTQADVRGRRRPCVARYFEFCKAVRASAPADLPPVARKIHVVAYIGFPKSYSKKKRQMLAGQEHEPKPDASGILKACEDALFVKDEKIFDTHCLKFWDDGRGPRVLITVER